MYFVHQSPPSVETTCRVRMLRRVQRRERSKGSRSWGANGAGDYRLGGMPPWVLSRVLPGLGAGCSVLPSQDAGEQGSLEQMPCSGLGVGASELGCAVCRE